ncbi:hypothetical protein JQ625_02040 [Bradyrhizobium diazoefficiens]|nr:hypothetical protein [Bradyrhizobium diazoefficiens]MBR0773602.1 hypothetical protein [Bradyrhizobium diazoefficiens]
MSDPTRGQTARIISILRSPAARKISFTLGVWRIDALAFEEIASAIALGDIEVVVAPAKGGGEAEYNFKKDLIVVPDVTYGAKITQQGAIIHECVHAFVDMENFTGQAESANEAAAYLAGMLYILHTGIVMPPIITPVGNLAAGIAKTIIGQPGAAVPKMFETDLRRAIASEPFYKRQGVTFRSPDHADGLWRVRALRGRTDIDMVKLPPKTRLA